MDYFAELWEVTEIANVYIDTRDSASNAYVLNVLQRLLNAWYQDLSLLYKKGSHLFFHELQEQNALQLASLEGVHSRVPNFCSLAVLSLWHNISYVYARLKDAYSVPNETAEDLNQHLHIAYNDITTKLENGDQQMEDADD